VEHHRKHTTVYMDGLDPKPQCQLEQNAHGRRKALKMLNAGSLLSL
jgi:hypothetical protein